MIDRLAVQGSYSTLVVAPQNHIAPKTHNFEKCSARTWQVRIKGFNVFKFATY